VYIIIVVRFVVSRAVTIKNVVFWDVALCRSWVNQNFGGTYRVNYLLTLVRRSRIFNPEDGGDTLLRNVG
jgi:hypothetical protein